MVADVEDREQRAPAGTTGAPHGNTGSLETHVTVVAVISLVLAVPVILLGLVIFGGAVIGAGFAETFSDVPGLGALITGAGLLVGSVIALLGVPGLIAGIGLLKRRAWAKVWTLVVAVLSLINIPIGTVFGIYAIWVMTRPQIDTVLT